MTTIVKETEQMILQFFRTKDDNELRQIISGYDVHEKLDEETIYEIKEQIWYLLTSHHIRWWWLLQEIKDLIEQEDEEEETRAGMSEED